MTDSTTLPPVSRPFPTVRQERRAWLASLASLAALFVVRPASAGTYLNRAAVLLGDAKREVRFLRGRLQDRELCQLLRDLAAARLEVASKMAVPPDVAAAHPHLLLALGGYQRATEAAAAGATGKFIELTVLGDNEAATFEQLLKHLGWTLPPYA